MVKVKLIKNRNGEEYYKITVIVHFRHNELKTPDGKRRLIEKITVRKDKKCPSEHDADYIGKMIERGLWRKSLSRKQQLIDSMLSGIFGNLSKRSNGGEVECWRKNIKTTLRYHQYGSIEINRRIYQRHFKIFLTYAIRSKNYDENIRNKLKGELPIRTQKRSRVKYLLNKQH